jgi:hypothetical protein
MAGLRVLSHLDGIRRPRGCRRPARWKQWAGSFFVPESKRPAFPIPPGRNPDSPKPNQDARNRNSDAPALPRESLDSSGESLDAFRESLDAPGDSLKFSWESSIRIRDSLAGFWESIFAARESLRHCFALRPHQNLLRVPIASLASWRFLPYDESQVFQRRHHLPAIAVP